MATQYMHTLNGKPAMFDGAQICFMAYHGEASPLAKSLAQIKKEQKASEEYRVQFDDTRWKASHLRVDVGE